MPLGPCTARGGVPAECAMPDTATTADLRPADRPTDHRPPPSPPAQRSRITEGQPHPLGATWDGTGVNFALFSAHATKVELCLFDNEGRREIERVELPEFSDEVWHGYLPDARP